MVSSTTDLYQIKLNYYDSDNTLLNSDIVLETQEQELGLILGLQTQKNKYSTLVVFQETYKIGLQILRL
jgi:hypothetical protein